MPELGWKTLLAILALCWRPGGKSGSLLFAETGQLLTAHADAALERRAHVAHRRFDTAEQSIAHHRVPDVHLDQRRDGRHLDHVVPGETVTRRHLEPPRARPR